MNLLEKIVADKMKNLEKMKKEVPLNEISSRALSVPPSGSFKDAIRQPGKVSIIAEIKKQSPSAGLIVQDFDPEKIAGIYKQAGAKAVSVLTEEKYFGGKAEDLKKAKNGSGLPLLRKDFTFDPYQLYEARSLGASAVLLIVAILRREQFRQLLGLSRELELSALVEVHSEAELDLALQENPEIIGINNRNLKDLKVDLGTTLELAEKIPPSVTLVSESGISSPDTIRQIRSAGVHAALIGESILKSREMQKTLENFVRAGYEN